MWAKCCLNLTLLDKFDEGSLELTGDCPLGSNELQVAKIKTELVKIIRKHALSALKICLDFFFSILLDSQRDGYCFKSHV